MIKKQALHKAPVPGIAKSDHFIFEPLLPDHVALDYEAVMSSKEYLRNWSQSDWPADQFTLKDNLADLERHHEEHVENQAYTFTILNPDRSICLGCIYIKPSDWIIDCSPQEKNKLKNETAVLSFWVRSSIQNHSMEESIFLFLLEWMKNDWQFPGLIYASNFLVPQQISLFQKLNLHLWMELSQPNRYQTLWKTQV